MRCGCQFALRKAPVNPEEAKSQTWTFVLVPRQFCSLPPTLLQPSFHRPSLTLDTSPSTITALTIIITVICRSIA